MYFLACSSGYFQRRNIEMPVGNLKKLDEAFDTLEDPMLQMKLPSMKRCVEETIALTQSHGKQVDWEKVSSSYARRPAEMKEFFAKAKEYTPKLVSLILSAPAPLTSGPLSSAPAPTDPAPTEVA
jgi:hypothetical protein